MGKLLPNALYVHRTALEHLEHILRVYEGCGRAYLGEIKGTTLLRSTATRVKISYLAYPDFEKEPHPALAQFCQAVHAVATARMPEFGQGGNPPVLHRKETFLHAEHELYEKFARLSRGKAGLLEATATIGTQEGWATRLTEKGYAIRGHRLVKAKVNGQPEAKGGSDDSLSADL